MSDETKLAGASIGSALAVNPESMPSGPRERFCYSFGVRTGDIVWVSGQVSMSAEGELVGIDDPVKQTEQVFANLSAVLAEAGGTLDDIVSTTTYSIDRAHTLEINDVRARHIKGPCPPTSTLIIVAGLARPEFLVEISAVAVIPKAS